MSFSQLPKIVIDPNQQTLNQITLTKEQHHYLNRVLRLKPLDHLIITNGIGDQWLAELTQPRSATILEPIITPPQSPIKISLMIAIPKNGFDDIIRSTTELGVNSIIPIITERTIKQPSQSQIDRWRKIAIEATEQSERTTIPQIHHPISLKQSISQTADMKYICIERQPNPLLLNELINQTKPITSIIITIGPEGGWTQTETQQAIASQFIPVSLGNQILRTVTASIVSIAILRSWIASKNVP